jgi:hypothetical protein
MSRTRLQRQIAKKMMRQPAGKLLPIDLTARDHPSWMTRAYSNNRYVVMINDHAWINDQPAIKVMIQRHDDQPIEGHWRELQNIKNELFGREACAIEFYPPESELEDVANIYWLWLVENITLRVTG